ncbi:MAG: MerR family transcriptional regulator [Candidatus Neomarinimicrobiota bacterium]
MSLNISIEADPFEPVISIGIAAKKLGVSPETLRLYEREGLIIPYKTGTNRRLYSQKDLEWINCFRIQITRNGLNIAGVRLLLALIPCWEMKPCTSEEQERCPVYMNGEKVCWLTENRSAEVCNRGECRECNVYRAACKAGKLNEMFLTVKR